MKSVSIRSKAKSLTFRFVVIAIVSIVLIFSLVIINPLDDWRSIYMCETTGQALLDLIWFGIMGWVITESSLRVSRWLDTLLPWERRPGWRFMAQLFAQILVITVLTTLFLFVTFAFFETTDTEMSDDDWVGLQQILFISVVLSLITTAIFTGDHLIAKWRSSVLEAAELKQANLQAQLQTLKAQLNPHFMFNNFSVLANLIAEDQENALQFLDRLSIVHRYMTNNLSRNIISLREELQFIEAYIYLIKIRFADNLHFTVDIPDQYKNLGIPPVTLQLLLENAVKHNIASRVQPLHISLTIGANGRLVVSNTLQRISYSIPSTEVGLQNIINRYKLLSAQTPEILETEEAFIVKLPLLSLNES